MVTNFFFFCCLHLSLKITSLDLKIEQIKLFSIKKDNKIGKEKKKASVMLKGLIYMYFGWWLLKNNIHIVLCWWQTWNWKHVFFMCILVRVYVAVIQQKDLFQLTVKLSIRKGNQGRIPETETEGEAIEERCFLTGLLSMSCSATLLYIIGPPTVGWALSP